MNLFYIYVFNFLQTSLSRYFSAAKFEVKKVLPPYLDPNMQLEDLLTGVSFASGGAGYDPLTAELVVNNQLSIQFNYYVRKLSPDFSGYDTCHLSGSFISN